MPESEHRNSFFSVVSEKIQRLVHKPSKVEVDFSTAVFVEPNLSFLPNPSDDLDGYDRYFILQEEKQSYYGGNHILRSQDLDTEVMKWIRDNYPGSYSTPGIRLHSIKTSWLEDKNNRKNDPDGWKNLLKDDRWKQFVPSSDFESNK